MSDQGVFRTKIFGGFNKKDVLNYFEQLKSEIGAENDDIAKENEQLKAELDEKSKKISELLEKTDFYIDKVKELEKTVLELSESNKKNANLESALFEANRALAQSEDFKSRFEELSRKILKIKSDFIMKESEYKKLENKYNALKSEILLLPNTDEDDLAEVKSALDQINNAMAQAQSLNNTVNALKIRIED